MKLEVLTVFLICLLQRLAAESQTLPVASLNPLTTVGAKFIGDEIKRASAAFQKATNDLNANTHQCQAIRDEKAKTKCVPCVTKKCQDKASSCNRKLTFSGVISSVADLGSKVTSSIKDVGHKVVDTVKHIFSGWGKRRVKRSEPSCSDIEHNAGQACQKYTSSCSECQFNPASECPGYTLVKTAYDSASHTYAWLKKVPTSGATYHVTKVTYDPTKFDPKVAGFVGITVNVNIFGKTTSFHFSQPIDVYAADKSANIIAKQALDWFKTH